MSRAIQLLVSDSWGMLIPQSFVRNYEFTGADEKDIETCDRGPDPENEWYWEAWENICRDAFVTIKDNKYRLYQDGDLFGICEEILTDDEYEAFFGEKRQ